MQMKVLSNFLNMNPILTLWFNSGLKITAAKSNSILKSEEEANLYKGINIDESTELELKETIQQNYRNLISLDATDTTLHIVAISPVDCPKFTSHLDSLISACNNSNVRVSLHILLLKNSLNNCIGINEEGGNEENNLKSLESAIASSTLPVTFSLIDDFVESGAPINFNKVVLAEYMAMILRTFIADYYKVVPVNMIMNPDERHIALGVSYFGFDKAMATDYLLHRAFISVLRHNGVEDSNVDAQKCMNEAQKLLSGINLLYQNFYNQEVHPLLKKQPLKHAQIAASISGKINNIFDKIEAHVSSLLLREDLTMPEKEGVLAMILGRDNSRLEGIQYAQDNLVLDDVSDAPLNYFISYFNHTISSGVKSSLLPIRGGYPALCKWEYDYEKNENVASPENDYAFNPLNDIKRLKREIMDSTAHIRKKEEQLDELRKNTEEIKNSNIEEQNVLRKKRQSKVNQVSEQPLDDKYSPQNIQPADSVDLREFFSEIKDQGEIGSCTTFAIVSMYEYVINRLENRKDGDLVDLSEQFVFHFSNVAKGHPEGGSNFYDQLAVLGQEGVCDDNLFEYSIDNISATPSQEAIENALTHRVLKAKQIPLSDGEDKHKSLQANHRLITSALTEGYPVGIALKISENFGKDSPYINRPTENTPDNNDINHAMVIVGYSEESKSYIVRNSWGNKFGDNGYCYVSAAYIDDMDFNKFACIITDTTEGEFSKEQSVPRLVAPFAGSQNQIQMAAIRNVLDEEYIKLKSKNKLYDIYYRYYSDLIQALEVPSNRQGLITNAQNVCASKLENISLLKNKKEEEFVPTLNEFKKHTFKIALLISLISLFFTIITVISWWKTSDTTSLLTIFTSISVVCIIASVCLWAHRKFQIRNKRRTLEEELGRIAINKNEITNELNEKQLSLHIAGQWMDRFHTLSLNMSHTYNNLLIFNEALCKWMANDQSALSSYQDPEGRMFISATSTDLLDNFYAEHMSIISNKIDLNKSFQDFNKPNTNLKTIHQKLKDDVRNEILKLFSDFSVFHMLTRAKNYTYTNSLSQEEILSKMRNLGQPSLRYRGMVESPISFCTFLNVPAGHENEWTNLTSHHLPSYVDISSISDPTFLILLQTHQFPISNIR